MGACLSCLGAKKESDEAERTRLLYEDSFHPAHNYGSWNQPTVPSQNILSPEEVKREQQALNNITRWASDQIVEIFPHQHRNMAATTTTQFNGFQENGLNASAHQDILLSMIPGDKSKRSIRIYPASRPGSKDAQSIRSKPSSSRMSGSVRGTGNSVFVKLKIDTS